MWQTTDYDYRGGYGDNCGFDGSFFTAPGPGIYSFHVTTRQDSVTTGNVYLYHIKSSANHVIVGHGSRSDDQNRNGNIIVQATIKLYGHEKVYVRLEGHLFDLGDATTTYFEGRLVSKID